MAQIYLKYLTNVLSSCLFLLLVCGCTAQMMTQKTFDQVFIGMSMEDVQTIAGEPCEIRKGGQGIEYHQYVERFEIAPGVTNQNSYVLTIVNGQVVDKQVKSISPRSGIRFQ